MSNGLDFNIKWRSEDANHLQFEVVEFEGIEAISQVYEFNLILRSTQLLAVHNLPIGHDASLLIQMENMQVFSSSEQQSTYSGIITEFSLRNKIKDYYYYQAVMSQRLAKLRYNVKSDVYIESGLADILRAVFNAQGFSQEDVQLAFHHDDPKYKSTNDYYNRYAMVCQYNESDLQFINRLLERDGVYYYFEPSTHGSDKLVITDSKKQYSKRDKSLRFRFLSDQSAAPDPNALHSFEFAAKLTPKQVTIINYGYEKANLGDNGVISCSAYVSENGQENKSLFGEEVIYGENFISPENNGDGQFLANIRAQELFCHSRICHAKSTAVPIRAGMKITIDDHQHDEFNGDYLVVSVKHKGQQSLVGMQEIAKDALFYENTLALLPLNIQYRPQRVTPWPKIYGTLNALIDGEQDSQLPQIDAHGRYKLRLPFLKQAKADGKGSIWVRLSTPYAGDGYGFQFPLVKGVEVVVAFRDGNPDLPIIINATYNSVNANFIGDANNYFGGAIISRAKSTLLFNDRDTNTNIGVFTNGHWQMYK